MVYTQSQAGAKSYNPYIGSFPYIETSIRYKTCSHFNFIMKSICHKTEADSLCNANTIVCPIGVRIGGVQRQKLKIAITVAFIRRLKSLVFVYFRHRSSQSSQDFLQAKNGAIRSDSLDQLIFGNVQIIFQMILINKKKAKKIQAVKIMENWK